MYCVTRYSAPHNTLEALSRDGINFTLHADKVDIMTNLGEAAVTANRFDRAVVAPSNFTLEAMKG